MSLSAVTIYWPVLLPPAAAPPSLTLAASALV
eukprot:CAMPEP_0173383552 /NCGR_PEP_ID=MMETSP1356-20130122/6129_1 /TAXON_ID=77927 ORGANISM="Hemiselmis virescens, Strain PCC157" /NCGR_SAMPLE_ID=MMETSP1356 /ASSEMBLY_ACC=CAM_ASM_000847 /LENGTH=31 /DNA_ID= /DNA_START= /DNA_END= /DNA_ORIENTATION=